MKAYLKYLLVPTIVVVFFGHFSMFMLVFCIALLYSLSCVYVPRGRAAVVLKDDKIVDVLVTKKFHWMGFRATPAHCVFIDLERHVSSWEKMKPRMLASYARSAYPKQIEQNELDAQLQEEQEFKKTSRLPIWAGRLTILGILFAIYFYFLVYPHSSQQVSVISRFGKIETLVYPPQQVWPIPFLDEVTSIDASDILSNPSLSEEQKNDAIIQKIVSK